MRPTKRRSEARSTARPVRSVPVRGIVCAGGIAGAGDGRDLGVLVVGGTTADGVVVGAGGAVVGTGGEVVSGTVGGGAVVGTGGDIVPGTVGGGAVVGTGGDVVLGAVDRGGGAGVETITSLTTSTTVG